MASNDYFDVIIIGCGAAGIGAAIQLQKYEPIPRFLILEARDRAGGRAFTDRNTFGTDSPVDVGARWLCHHQSNHVLQAYFTRSDKDWIESDLYDRSSMVIFDDNGTIISDDLIEQAEKMAQNIMLSVQQYPLDKPDVSILNVIEDQLAAISNEGTRRLVRMFLSFVENHEGSDLAELSTKLYTKGEGDLEECDLALADGFGALIKRIAEQHNLPIEFNTIVTHIDTSTRLDQLVCISTQDKRNYLCKHVIMTVPLGCLKKHSINFTPALPVWKIEAIDQMGISLLNKVYLQFPSIFWNPKLRRISIATNHFKHFYCIPEARILVLYIVGSIARELEQKSDEEIIMQIVESLRRIYPQMEYPSKWLVTRWGSDPFSCGSYSSFHVGSDISLLKILAHETHEGRVHWAGEHTNYEGSIGYVDSAFESGQREAIQIQKKLKQSF